MKILLGELFLDVCDLKERGFFCIDCEKWFIIVVYLCKEKSFFNDVFRLVFKMI